MRQGLLQHRGPATGEAAVTHGGRAVPVDFVVTGGITDDAVDLTIQRIETVLRHVDDPILFIRLKLRRDADPARRKPVTAQIVLDVNGTPVRAQVAAPDVREAADLLQRRLNDQFEQRAQHRAARRSRSGIPGPGRWRHGDVPTARPDYYDRPIEERRVVRHKTFAIGELTPDEAAFDMDQMDYDFHLFSELATGEDAVLERLSDGAFRLTRLHAGNVDEGPLAIALTVASSTPPILTAGDAQLRLNAGDERFLFYADATTGRGNVVYRRYDGHLGLITPA